ncbi:MAG: nicotinate phosphoribosyltransferase [Eubacteriaceae bacterium]|jgi:nicotinate phosphoribosyltransferase
MHFDRKLELATDLYQMSMGNVYFEEGKQNQTAVFDMFIRNNPFNGGYTVAAGLEQVIEYIQGLSFTDEEVDRIGRNHPEFTKGFLDYLRQFRFTGELYALPEGTIFFPFEPIIRVKAPLIEAQMVETTMLSIINHQTLIATKASRIRDEAPDDVMMEFGLRRAHGTEAGFFGARAAVIGGFNGTSVVETEEMLDRPSMGTMAHSFVLSYDSEEEAFEAFAKYNPQNAVVLVDTFDTLNSGVPAAIRIFQKLKKEDAITGIYGIRIDSGDLAYLTREARRMLDDAGLTDALICASSDLDEYLIKDLKGQGAKIDSWGIGTKLITAYDCPALGGVYKLAQIDDRPKLKVSNDPWKITNPGYKKINRIYGENGKALADLITFVDEEIDQTQPLTIFHPVHPWKRRRLTGFHVEELLKPIFIDGKLVYEKPTIKQIQEHLKQEKESVWPEYKRIVNPDVYHVDLSQKVWDTRQDLLKETSVIRDE